ncbi:hypothetical protein ABK040_004120 [Willaertia magna]
MYSGNHRIGNITNPFKNSSNSDPTLSNSIKIEDENTYHWDDLITDEYFQLPKENYLHSKHHDDKSTIPINKDDPLVWIDIETSGLDYNKDKILEISCVITTSNLELIAEHETSVVHQSDEFITKNFSEWCKKQHALSGLTEDIRNSKLLLKDIETNLLIFLQRFTRKQQTNMAGNSIYFDKQFIQQNMPLLNAHFGHRLIDVSSISEMAKRWYPQVYAKAPPKIKLHRSRLDIYESIRELMFYRKYLFRK